MTCGRQERAKQEPLPKPGSMYVHLRLRSSMEMTDTSKQAAIYLFIQYVCEAWYMGGKEGTKEVHDVKYELWKNERKWKGRKGQTVTLKTWLKTREVNTQWTIHEPVTALH